MTKVTLQSQALQKRWNTIYHCLHMSSSGLCMGAVEYAHLLFSRVSYEATEVEYSFFCSSVFACSVVRVYLSCVVYVDFIFDSITANNWL